MSDIFITGVAAKYPKELLKNRASIEGNLIGCFLKDMLLLDGLKLDTDDWITRDGLFYFSMLKQLRKKGFYKIDDVTVASNLPQHVIQEYEERGGYEPVRHLIELINTENFEGFLDELYKSNIILAMHRDGFNLLGKIKLENGKTTRPVDLFEKLDAEGVTEWYEARINSYTKANSSKIIEDGDIEFSEEYIQSCIEGEQNGVPIDTCLTDISGEPIYCYPFLQRQISGFTPGTFNLLCGYSGVGKSSLYIGILMALMAHGRKVLVISNEESKSQFLVRFLVWVLYKYNHYTRIGKKEILSGNINEEDRKQIAIARKWWEENFQDNIHFIAITEMDMSLVKQLIRNNVLRFGYDTILVDTFKLDMNTTGTERTDLGLLRDSRTMDSIAKKYNIIVLCSLQLAIATQGKLFLDASVLSQSKQIKEVASTMLLMRNVYDEELDKDDKRFYIRPFRSVKKNDVWEEEEFECNRNEVWRCVFVDKSRSGANSSDNGVAYLLKYRGNYCHFSESAKCRPRHGEIK